MNNQQFTIAPTEPYTGVDVESWNDLTELFQEDFFPNEMDFANIFSEKNDFNFLSEKIPFDSTVTTSVAASTSPMEGSNDDGSDTGENLTSDQRLDRRNRNREHAKKSRLRKRVLLDTLQDQLSQLHAQNIALRRVVSERLPPELSSQLLLQCTTTESTLLHSEHQPLPSMLTKRLKDSQQSSTGEASEAQKALMEPDYRLMQSLITSQQNFVLSDPQLPDNPIIYASEGFLRLSGYSRQEILGRNCRFLQGPKTDPAAVALVRQGLADGEDVSVCLLNYRKDGSTFWNQFFLGALKDSAGKVVNYVGVQCEVNMQPVSGIKDRVKKLPLPGV